MYDNDGPEVKEKARTEDGNQSDDKDTLISIEESRASYGTMENKSEQKRFCFKLPDGKMVYGHHTSQSDSMMKQKKSEYGGIFAQFSSNRVNQLENYFRAIDYIEQNIDFPPDSEDDPVEMYSFQKHIFVALCILITFFNVGACFLAMCHKNKVVDNLTKRGHGSNKSSFINIFIIACIAVDVIFFLGIFLTGTLAY